MDIDEEIALVEKSIAHLYLYREYHKDYFGVCDDDYRIDLMLYFHNRALKELLLQKEQT